jgi:hypothetical protein
MSRVYRRYLSTILGLAKIRRLLVPAIGHDTIAEAGAK